MKFIVFCPDANTGGPFALLQLAKAINDLNYECEVYFYNIGTVKVKKIKKNFIKNMIIDGSYTIKYKRKPRINIPNLSYKVCNDITVNDTLIFPEVALDYSTTFYNLGFKKRVFWWLSWNNAPFGNLTKFNNIINLKNCMHIFQSKYAQKEAARLDFKGLMVSDFTIFDETTDKIKSNKTNDICFLEGKAPGTELLVKELRNYFSVISIKKMSQAQVIQTLKNSKIFIDFGSHPGKVRIPREAALHNCIPLVHNVGAAKYFEDLTISRSLKLDTNAISDAKILIKKINTLASNFDNTLQSIAPYKNKIRNERDIFYEEVQNFLSEASEK